jgi:Transcriptional regulator
LNDEQLVTSQRRNRTKEHLKSALIKLIKEKGYHSVSVKDIVDSSSYNRSTFYVHYQDKEELADELLATMLQGLADSVGENYIPGQKVLTAKLNAPSFNIVTYIYENRDFFELVNYDDTLPGLLMGFPNAILKIYQELFVFETIDNIPVNMDYFKRYTAYGFYGLVLNWIQNGFRESRETFIQEVIDLTKTHMYAVKYIGGK